MAIDKRFLSELRRLQRIPERALYRQSMRLSRGIERGIGGNTSPSATPDGNRTKTVAREVLFFLGAVFFALLLGFIVFYLFGVLFSDSFVQLANDFGLVKLYYFLSFCCFVGIYITRLTVWAIKTVSGR